MKKLNNVNLLDGISEEHKGLTVLPNYNYNSYFVLGTQFNVEVEAIWDCNVGYYYEEYYKNVDYDLFSKFTKDFVDSLDLIIKDFTRIQETNLDKHYFYLNINDFFYKQYNQNGFNDKNGLLNIGDCKKFIEIYRENEKKEITKYYQSNFPTRYNDEEYSGFID